jgi:glycosyltransferase involved in cell wall biosynthesis
LKIENYKVAIFYDWINQWGGAEKVLLDILKIFPQSDILTFYYKKQNWLPNNIKIFTPPFNFKKYDLIISTSSYFGYLIPADIYYFHNVNRYFYNSPFKYIDRLLLHKNKAYFCNSKNTQNKIKKHFNIDAKIIYPGIDTKLFTPIKNPSNDYFLCVARLVPYKNIDKAIISCQKLKQKLIIVGTGRQKKYLQSIANPKYIQFTGKISQEKLIKLYQNCRALIFPQIEDFGLTALEAQSCGRPVIAKKTGGALETITPKTGLFFQNNLTKTLKKFKTKKFDPQLCRQNALKFSDIQFMLNFKKQNNVYFK